MEELGKIKRITFLPIRTGLAIANVLAELESPEAVGHRHGSPESARIGQFLGGASRGQTGSATVLIVCYSRIAKIVNLRFPFLESC